MNGHRNHLELIHGQKIAEIKHLSIKTIGDTDNECDGSNAHSEYGKF